MDKNGLILCKMQGELFENYSEFSSCSPYVFIRRFMYSKLAQRFDNKLILLDCSSVQTMVEEIDEQYGPTRFGHKVIYSKEIMYWVGYVYRYWAYIYEVPSSSLYAHVIPSILYDRYEMYHTMDVEYAIKRIIEEYKPQ